MLKTKFFRIATEGATTDGRAIERGWLQQMADSYDPKKYGARIWVEHMRSFSPSGDFGAYGDVLALEAREVEDGKLALFAQISPLPELIKLNRQKQKLYTSMEVDANFADTGKAYLVGLAVTDSPASLGTEILEFSAKNPAASPFAMRKQKAENMFTAAIEATIDLDEEQPSLADRVRKMFAKAESNEKRTAAKDADFTQAIDLVVEHVAGVEKRFDDLAEQVSGFSSIEQELSDLKKNFSDLMSTLESQDGTPGTTRQPAAGGAGQILTDC